MSKEERFECFIDKLDEFDWYIKDNKNNEQFDYLEDITKLLNQQEQRIVELEKQLVEKDNLLKMYPKLEDMYPQLPTIVINKQDKISFAIKQLNLLYETLTTEDVWKVMKKGWWPINGECLQLRRIIDKQIKEIKDE